MTSERDAEEMQVGWKQRADDLVWKEIEGEVIVLDLRSARYLSLNATGVLLWEALESEKSKQQLAELLEEHFDLPPEQARHDAVAFADSCASLGLIEHSDT